MPRKQTDTKDDSDMKEIPTINEDSSSLGEIKINIAVIQSIVKLAASEVEGVVAVGKGGFVDEVSSFITKKDTGSGIQVEEESGSYHISIRVILSFGYELAKTAYRVQTAVRDQVSKMTNKRVARVDVIIDGVKPPEAEGSESDDDIGLAPHNTD